MTNLKNDNMDLEVRLIALQQQLVHDSPTIQDLIAANAELSEIADFAGQTGQPELSRGASLLARVLELAACSGLSPKASRWFKQLVGFFRDFVPELQRVAETGSDESGNVNAFIELAEEQWSDYLELLDDQGEQQDDWSPSLDAVEDMPDFENEIDEPAGVANEQIELLLSAVTGSASPTEQDTDLANEREPEFPANTVQILSSTANCSKLTWTMRIAA